MSSSWLSVRHWTLQAGAGAANGFALVSVRSLAPVSARLNGPEKFSATASLSPLGEKAAARTPAPDTDGVTRPCTCHSPARVENGLRVVSSSRPIAGAGASDVAPTSNSLPLGAHAISAPRLRPGTVMQFALGWAAASRHS